MYGLALEGGGAKGSYHMGVVKALREEGYEFGGVAGTSIGALNGAIIAQGDFDAGYKLWETLDTAKVFNIGEESYKKILNREFDKVILSHMASRLRKIVENHGLDTSNMRKIIENIVDEDKLRRSKVDFGLVTVSLSGFKPLELYKEDIPRGSLVDYLMASANFPGFKINPVNGEYLIDGGLYNNCPINLLVEKGYKDIIVIRTFSVGIIQKVEGENLNIRTVSPSESLGKILNFNNEIIRKNLNLGYFDAKKMTRNLKGRKYYIYSSDEEIFRSSFSSLSLESITYLKNLLGIKDTPSHKMLFEKLIPLIIQKIGLKSNSSYQDVVVSLFEILAEEKEMNRFKLYTFREFLSELRKLKLPEKGLKPKIARDSMLLGSLSKKAALKLISEEIFKEFAYKIIKE